MISRRIITTKIQGSSIDIQSQLRCTRSLGILLVICPEVALDVQYRFRAARSKHGGYEIECIAIGVVSPLSASSDLGNSPGVWLHNEVTLNWTNELRPSSRLNKLPLDCGKSEEITSGSHRWSYSSIWTAVSQRLCCQVDSTPAVNR